VTARLTKSFFAAAVAAVILGCGDSSSNTDDPGGQSPRVTVVDSTNLSLQSDADELAQGRYRFAILGNAPALDTGTVIVGAQNGGFLRIVRQVTNSGGMLDIQTDPASLTDAVRDGELHFSGSTIPSANVAGVPKGVRWGAPTLVDGIPGVTIVNGVISLKDVVLSGSPASGLSIRNGSITFAPTAKLDVSIGLSSITRFEASIGGSITLDADLVLGLQGALSATPDPIIIAGTQQPFLSSIGPLLVYGRLVTTFSLVPSLEAQGQATVQTGLTATGTLNLGAKYENGSWQSLSGPSTSLNVKPLTATIGGRVVARFGVKVESRLLLYETVGPYLWVEPYVEADAVVDLLQNSWNTSCVSAITAGVGISVKIFSHVLADFNASNDFLRSTWPICARSGTLVVPGTITAVSGNNQTAGAGSRLPNPLVVQVVSSAGQPVPGAAVTFATPDGGSVQPVVAFTDLTGLAQSNWTLSSAPGSQRATASVAGYVGSPVTFTALATNTTACPPTPYVIGTQGAGTLSAGDCQFSNTHESFDNYTAVLPAPAVVRLTMTSQQFTPYFTVNIDPAAAVSDGFIAPAGGSTVTEKAIFPAGTIYIRPAARGVGTTGSYTFAVTHADGDITGCENVVLAANVTATLQLAPADCYESGWYADRFDIALGVGWTATLTMHSTAFDALVELHDGSDQFIASDDDGAGGTDARLVYTNTSSDILRYFVHAKSYLAGATGPYTLRLTITAPAGLMDASGATTGGSVAPAIPRRP
jgi:hypothetical protein